MKPAPRAALEIGCAMAAAVGCVLSWLAAGSFVRVAPVIDGETSTTSLTYYPPLLFLALVLATVAGMLAVVAVARLRRGRATEITTPPYTP